MNKRVLELDYMRALAIIMVLMGHVLLFSFKIESSVLLGIIGICEMPLFFVVSGFLSFKQSDEVCFKDEGKRLLRRSFALLIPLVVWSFLLNLCNDNITYSIRDFNRGGYWFFLALWQCDVINVLPNYISKKLKFGLFKDLAFYSFIYLIILVARIKNIDLGGLLLIHHVQYYFPIFVLGFMMKKYFSVYKVFLNKYTYTVSIIVLLTGWYLYNTHSFMIWFPSAIAAVVIFWIACKEIQPDSKIAMVLSKVGKRTIAVYAIHYFLIQEVPFDVQSFVNVPMAFFFLFLATLIYAVCMISVCLVADKLLSMNPITKFIFWGETKK